MLRGALRLRTEVVHLVAPPRGSGQHLLTVDVPGGEKVALLADPAGNPREDGAYPLNLRPVTRVQMAELFTIVEKLDEPSGSVPPPPSGDDEELAEDTIVNAAPSRIVVPQPAPTTAYAKIGSKDPIPDDAPLDELLEVVDSIPPPPSSDFEISSSSLLRASGTNVVPAVPPPPSGAPARPPSSSAMKQVDKRIGRVLAGKYHIDAPIGAGAAATVYRATHKDLRRSVAVKILHAENQSESQFIRRFKAEALTASKLEHVNVTRIIDFGQEGGELYLVMELVVGKSLDATLAVGGPLPAKRVIGIGIQVCRALTFAHRMGVVHRDIKPENIMLVPDMDDDGDPTDLVKVCDFGLAKMRDPGDGEGEITVTGMLCGSPAYMSPEQTRGDTIDARTDIYSLGVSLFEALTGALPYEAFSIGELFLKKCTQTPRRASTLVTVDAVLDDIVARAMAIDPRARHASAKELRTELRAALDVLDDDGNSSATLLGG
ncbi:MAG: serine/threonine protein kinase [Labilithrix sp.]|nr:serine/threonine protein kinase [Labilithrix sp.]MCW5813587.1 serine/threonine protein kinase [Labilithrix sp.]